MFMIDMTVLTYLELFYYLVWMCCKILLEHAWYHTGFEKFKVFKIISSYILLKASILVELNYEKNYVNETWLDLNYSFIYGLLQYRNCLT